MSERVYHDFSVHIADDRTSRRTSVPSTTTTTIIRRARRGATRNTSSPAKAASHQRPRRGRATSGSTAGQHLERAEQLRRDRGLGPAGHGCTRGCQRATQGQKAVKPQGVPNRDSHPAHRTAREVVHGHPPRLLVENIEFSYEPGQKPPTNRSSPARISAPLTARTRTGRVQGVASASASPASPPPAKTADCRM